MTEVRCDSCGELLTMISRSYGESIAEASDWLMPVPGLLFCIECRKKWESWMKCINEDDKSKDPVNVMKSWLTHAVIMSIMRRLSDIEQRLDTIEEPLS